MELISNYKPCNKSESRFLSFMVGGNFKVVKKVLLYLLLVFMLEGCKPSTAELITFYRYQLTYDGNGNTDGTVPRYFETFKLGEAVVIEGNSGNLKKGGKEFLFWNTKPDRSGVSYLPGDTLELSNKKSRLYAQYSEVNGPVVINPPVVIPPVVLPPIIDLPVNPTLGASVDALITGQRYYIDPVSGLDSSDGSIFSPWKTLSKAQSVALGGDGVILRSGNYGLFSEQDGGRSSYLVYRNDAGAVPVFTGIDLDYSAGNGDSYLVFYGVRILPEWVAPGGDPQDPASTQTTYAKTATPVVIRAANHVQILGSNIGGQRKYLTPCGVSVADSTYVQVEGCIIHDVHRGIINTASQFLAYKGNHIHRITGSAFMSSDAASNDILIEGNHAHDSNYNYADDYCPRALNANYHGSAVAIRGDRMTIRNNIFHDGFNSAGIMTYDQDSPASDIDYSEILIENNLLYDIRNVYVLRFYLISSNIVVRNNIFASYWRSFGTQYYNTAVNIDSVALGLDGSMLTFDNNIVLGTTNFGAYWGTVNQHNNIFYSCRPGVAPYLTEAEVGGGSMVATGDPATTSYLFEQDFFNGVLRFDMDSSDPTNPVGHGQLLDFSLYPLSPAEGYGDPLTQPADGLGLLGADGFIQTSLITRSGARHNAGPYP